MAANGSMNVEIAPHQSDSNYGQLEIMDGAGNTRIRLKSDPADNGAGEIRSYGPNGNTNCAFKTHLHNQDLGKLVLYDSESFSKAIVGILNPSEAGWLSLIAPNLSENAYLGTTADHGDYGALYLMDDAGEIQVYSRVSPDSGAGELWTAGPSGYLNIGLTTVSDTQSEFGFLGIYDDQGRKRFEPAPLRGRPCLPRWVLPPDHRS